MKEKSALKQNKVTPVYYYYYYYYCSCCCYLPKDLVNLFQEVLELAFSVLYDPDETLNFVAPNKYEVGLRKKIKEIILN